MENIPMDIDSQRVLLLVDDEENILRSLRRTFHRCGYKILVAQSGEAGLKTLEEHEVGVIVSDQRMPGMIGSEFLSQVRERFPDTVRIMLSGYTELNSVTDAINKGAIYKFLTKPWEDEQIRTNIKEAFEYFELRQENQRLTNELSEMNRKLEQRVKERTREVQLSTASLQVAHDVLEALPTSVVGVDCNGMIVTANQSAHKLLDESGSGLVGRKSKDVFPFSMQKILESNNDVLGKTVELEETTRTVSIYCSQLHGWKNEITGKILVCMPISPDTE